MLYENRSRGEEPGEKSLTKEYPTLIEECWDLEKLSGLIRGTGQPLIPYSQHGPAYSSNENTYYYPGTTLAPDVPTTQASQRRAHARPKLSAQGTGTSPSKNNHSQQPPLYHQPQPMQLNQLYIWNADPQQMWQNFLISINQCTSHKNPEAKPRWSKLGRKGGRPRAPEPNDPAWNIWTLGNMNIRYNKGGVTVKHLKRVLFKLDENKRSRAIYKNLRDEILTKRKEETERLKNLSSEEISKGRKEEIILCPKDWDEKEMSQKGWWVHFPGA